MIAKKIKSPMSHNILQRATALRGYHGTIHKHTHRLRRRSICLPSALTNTHTTRAHLPVLPIYRNALAVCRNASKTNQQQQKTAENSSASSRRQGIFTRFLAQAVNNSGSTTHKYTTDAPPTRESRDHGGSIPIPSLALRTNLRQIHTKTLKVKPKGYVKMPQHGVQHLELINTADLPNSLSLSVPPRPPLLLHVSDTQLVELRSQASPQIVRVKRQNSQRSIL